MENSGFYDGGALYGQDEFNRYFDNIYRSGVSLDDTGAMTLAVSGGAGSVGVAAGFAILRGFWYYNDSPKSLAVSAPATLSRIDRVVLRLTITAKTITAALKQGTEASSPQPPALQRDSNVYEISLAQVRVTTAGAITVTDERPLEDVCGAIRPKNLTEYDDMIATFQAQWQAWFNSQQAAGWRNIYIQDTQPTSPEVGSIWIR